VDYPKTFFSYFPALESLDLGDNSIERLPDTLGVPLSLRKFTLRGNRLGSLPENFFENLGYNISDIALEKNQLEQIPAFTKNLKNLKNLSLSHNLLTELPDSMEHLKNMNVMRLDFNRLIRLPNSIGELEQCTKIILIDNHLTSLPDTFGGLITLNWLDLSFNPLTALPEAFKNLESLSYFNLRKTKVNTEDGLKPLWNLPKLTELDLSEIRLQVLPSEITNLPSLGVLRLSGNQLSEAKFPDLSSLPNFSAAEPINNLRTALFLNDNLFQQVPLQVLLLKSLQVFTMEGNLITSIPPGISEMRDLKVLILSPGYRTFIDNKNTAGEGEGEASPQEIVFPELERLYLCPRAGDQKNVKEKIALPKFLSDSDIPDSGYIASLSSLAYHVTWGPAIRQKAFSQMLGSGFHEMEDTLAISSWEHSSLGLIEYFAIFDGHGGTEVSSFVQSKFHIILQEKLATEGHDGADIKNILLSTFTEMNDQVKKFLSKKSMLNKVVGSTAVVILIINAEIYSANLGDSRAILVSRDEKNEDLIVGKPLSFDHKPSDREEEQRIRKAGGFITASPFEGGMYRVNMPSVNNGLGVARAFGDFPVSPGVGDEPYYYSQKLTSRDLYLVIGCDGIWDVLSNQDAAEIVYRQGKRGMDLAAHTLRGWAYSLGSGDDLSVIVAQL